ncbi:VTT domain-containing protein [Undibacterium sp. TS12]|uniref:VTT domain-containing protein n=1 Tax=Undibacterium sp. TS12 TaxID=2908202 RepID=UPI001F4CC55A|nr:VTT domain-containing protein [Undibacterium sp. TS12]MCH8618672.1 VTT domain-containing protein [Undibacterium sp. TS12]
MEHGWLADFFHQHNSLMVFVNVLLQQLGLPVPAVPTMMFNASQTTHTSQLLILLLSAIIASLTADLIWYQAGKKFGYKVLKFLCKMSINPGSCVNQTEARFHRWGVWSLVVGKFIPGFSTVAPPVAGALGMSRVSFMLASAIGAGLWAGLALLAGFALQAQIESGLALLSQHGIRIVAVFVALLLVWLAWKFWQKKRFEKLATIPHFSPAELKDSYQRNAMPRIIDLRSPALIAETGVIPKATVSETKQVGIAAQAWPKHEMIITICACPGDAGAVHAAHTLKQLGFEDVRPFAGGFDAWRELANTYPGLLEKI